MSAELMLQAYHLILKMIFYLMYLANRRELD